MRLITLLDFGLAQIIPLPDGMTVAAASFVDTFVLLLGEDGHLSIFRADDSGDLEDLQIGETLASQEWQSGSLYDDVNDCFGLTNSKGEDELTSILMFLLTVEGGLQVNILYESKADPNACAQVFCMPNLDSPVYVAPGLKFVPPFLSTDFSVRRSSARTDLVEILVAEIGDKFDRAPFLIVRIQSCLNPGLPQLR